MEINELVIQYNLFLKYSNFCFNNRSIINFDLNSIILPC